MRAQQSSAGDAIPSPVWVGEDFKNVVLLTQNNANTVRELVENFSNESSNDPNKHNTLTVMDRYKVQWELFIASLGRESIRNALKALVHFEEEDPNEGSESDSEYHGDEESDVAASDEVQESSGVLDDTDESDEEINDAATSNAVPSEVQTSNVAASIAVSSEVQTSTIAASIAASSEVQTSTIAASVAVSSDVAASVAVSSEVQTSNVVSDEVHAINDPLSDSEASDEDLHSVGLTTVQANSTAVHHYHTRSGGGADQHTNQAVGSSVGNRKAWYLRIGMRKGEDVLGEKECKRFLLLLACKTPRPALLIPTKEFLDTFDGTGNNLAPWDASKVARCFPLIAELLSLMGEAPPWVKQFIEDEVSYARSLDSGDLKARHDQIFSSGSYRCYDIDIDDDFAQGVYCAKSLRKASALPRGGFAMKQGQRASKNPDLPAINESGCNKNKEATPTCTPGWAVMCCEHGTIYYCSLLKRAESIRLPYEILLNRFKLDGLLVVYDNACSLATYATSRNPVAFRNTRWVIDRFHSSNHNNTCSEILSLYCNVSESVKQLLSQCVEVANQKFRKMSTVLHYMTSATAMEAIKELVHKYNTERMKEIRLTNDSRAAGING